MYLTYLNNGFAALWRETARKWLASLQSVPAWVWSAVPTVEFMMDEFTKYRYIILESYVVHSNS